ncbi:MULTISPECIES: homogentisate 1,2-dioxygenase [unclassified Frankia]|uniref:homogentisate 1,2-dioxygenase n=1 Tax=unclassified Frankia TaxID=2632575 RepID=UPI002AD4494E|nr:MULTISPECIES: homogentisate 1,2-dioxygenase domain-containing protein [unclassified Frankia]
MAYYRQVGSVPAKRHTRFHNADGGLLYEELMGEEGFSSDSVLLYHQYIPSALAAAEEWALPDRRLVANTPLLPRHYRLHDLFPGEAGSTQDLVTGRALVLGNSDVCLSYVVAGRSSPLYRNAIGDELVYVEEGRGTVETAFGVLPFRTGDYVLLPRATAHRWVPNGIVRCYVVEATGHVTPPKRYLSAQGQFLEHAPFCERDLHAPTEPLVVDDGPVELFVKHRGAGGGPVGTRWELDNHPFDVVGWDGCLYPYTFNIGDFEPITGRIHQPPPAHQVFEGRGFVVCNFVPRKVDYHPLAIPVPYFHSNVDSDEVMFYCGGDYEARKGSGIAQGSISLHPGGHPHGPQPGAVEASIGRESFDELAVMVDTFAPLLVGPGGLASEDAAYFRSWSR